ncbi:MAG: GAF domain-containing sensor histidine kinase [Candidatus Omnitrophica bacterium]|nr:GAF domain-containing sensor histidine kinase [Candidatus Omnitrophota bacterium]
MDENRVYWSYLHIGVLLSLYYRISRKKKERIVAYLAYVVATIFVYLHLATSYFTDGVIKYSWGYYPRASSAHPIFLVFFIGIICLIIYHTFISYLRRDQLFTDTDRRKEQIKYLFWAYILYSPACIDYVANYSIAIYPFGYIFATSFLAIVAYAIVKHQLMGIEVIIKRTLVFAGLFASAFAILVLPTLILQEFIVSQLGVGGRITGLSISAVLIALIYKRLHDFLVKVTDKFLFQKKYDYKQLLKTFTTEVLTVLELKKLVDLTAAKLTEIMKIESCGVLLLDKTRVEYDLVASQGIVDKKIILTKNSTLTTFLGRTRSYLSVKHQGTDSPLPKRIVEDMNRLKLELAIPLVIHEDMIGILTLGKKKSDEDYTQDDMDIILPLANTLAIAISNAEVLDELSKTQAEAAQREKMAVIGTLSAGINHEICNPLGIARGQCEAFLLNLKDGIYKNKTPDELVQKAKTIMEKVIHETDRATVITKRLSTFSKPSKGLLNDDIDVKMEIDEVLALVGYEMKLDKIEVENKIPTDLPHITGDKKQIQEVFFNLIRNAAQAIHEKGSIAITANEDIDRVCIKVQDTGHGIPREKLEQIFNPFYTTKEPGKGTGLGLFIVRQVVERNKGRISVDSTVGKGTVFTLTFPALKAVKV